MLSKQRRKENEKTFSLKEVKGTPCRLVSFLVLSCWTLLFLLAYEIVPAPIFFLFLSSFFFILNKTASCKNKISSSSESDMISKELHNSDFIFYSENLMTDVLRIIVKYRRKIVTKYRHLSPSGNRPWRWYYVKFKQWLFIEPNYLPKIEKLGPYILILLVFNAFFADHSMVFFFKFVLRMKLLKQSFVYIERRGGQYI